MDVRLSPEQQALRDSAAQVVDRLGPQTVGALDDDERAAKLDAAVAASGWRELRAADGDAPPTPGVESAAAASKLAPAPLASGVEVALIAEELGRGLADVPFLGPTLAAELRRLAGAPAAATLETVALGAGLGALASSAPDAPPEDGVSATVAVDAAGAVVALALLPDPADPATHLVATIELEPASDVPLDQRVDLTRPSARLAGAAAIRLADQGRALTDEDLMRWTALALAATSADLVGAMRGAVQLACTYAADREQYGVAIGSFQAVQHLLADAFVAMEGSRSAALHAAWAVDALPADEALLAAAVAKAYCSRAARTVCETAIQVHGGIGNTWECLAHVFLRRALLSSDILGGAGASLDRVLAARGIHRPGSDVGSIARSPGGPDGLR